MRRKTRCRRFKLAIEQGADGFEADFYLTRDGHVVCFHDKDTERITGKKLPVTETPFDELRRLDVGSWKGPQWKGEQMPTLEEVLAAVPDGKKDLHRAEVELPRWCADGQGDRCRRR